jgi:hypothetical protein
MSVQSQSTCFEAPSANDAVLPDTGETMCTPPENDTILTSDKSETTTSIGTPSEQVTASPGGDPETPTPIQHESASSSHLIHGSTEPILTSLHPKDIIHEITCDLTSILCGHPTHSRQIQRLLGAHHPLFRKLQLAWLREIAGDPRAAPALLFKGGKLALRRDS